MYRRESVYGYRGFPAHAGMDRTLPPRPRRIWRFPRPRGDGPSPTASACAVASVSPPTRGWTLLLGDTALFGTGFPAHAGMDPGRIRLGFTPSGFPRPRGDGPVRVYEFDVPDSVSPPTRGWTHLVRAGHHRHKGFPAHAGMDPERR